MIFEAALSYAARGWKVFPCHAIDANGCCTCGTAACGDAGKHPRSRYGVKEASDDRAKIHEWFGPGAPLSNIGVATGQVSGITVLDVDIGDGKGGAETWQSLIAQHGEPKTLMVETGSGGMHLYFQYNSALKTSSHTLGPGVDCRNDRGYVLAPPSNHRSGGQYKWLNDDPIAPLPAHLTQRRETRGRPRKDDAERRTYTEAEVAEMLEHVSQDDRDVWRNVGVILGRTFNRSDAAWEVYQTWSARWKGKPGRNHDEIMHEAFHKESQKGAEKQLGLGTIIRAALAGGWAPKAGEVPVGNFIYYGPGNNFIYRPTSAFWIAAAVDAAVSPVNDKGKLIPPSEWLKRNALTTSMTKDPSLESDFTRGFDCRDGIILPQQGAALYNNYRGPTIELGDARMAKPFLDHVRKVFPREGDADQFLDYMAHRVQRPEEKPRFALMLAGNQGVGKDTAVEFCSPAIGSWNVSNIEPSALDSAFNEFAASVLVRVSESANLHDMSKWAFNERMKVLIAGTPDYVAINPKYGQKYSVRMHCGVILTTNHLISGIYIPPDDRRYDVIECATRAEMGIPTDADAKAYFGELWDWFNEDGASHVAAFLNERDIRNFSASSGQRKTSAHSSVIASNLNPDHWLLDALEALGDPSAVRSDAIIAMATKSGQITERELAGKLNAAMARAGYVIYRNVERKDGRWKFDKTLTTVYIRPSLTAAEAETLRKTLTDLPF